MKCYYHPNWDAVCVCKSCARGLCHDCAVDLGDGLACVNRCEEKVRYLNAMYDHTRKQTQGGVQATFVLAVFFLLAGSTFIFIGLTDTRFRWLVLLGVPILLLSVPMWNAARGGMTLQKSQRPQERD